MSWRSRDALTIQTGEEYDADTLLGASHEEDGTTTLRIGRAAPVSLNPSQRAYLWAFLGSNRPRQ